MTIRVPSTWTSTGPAVIPTASRRLLGKTIRPTGSIEVRMAKHYHSIGKDFHISSAHLRAVFALKACPQVRARRERELDAGDGALDQGGHSRVSGLPG